MTNPEDQEDFDAATIIATLNRHGVQYVVIGASLLSCRVHRFRAHGTSTSLRLPIMTTCSDCRQHCTN